MSLGLSSSRSAMIKLPSGKCLDMQDEWEKKKVKALLSDILKTQIKKRHSKGITGASHLAKRTGKRMQATYSSK